jgi:hypothetical protein
MELESLTYILVHYALGKAQMDIVMSSKKFYFRSICKKYCTLQVFKVMSVSERPQPGITIKSWPRKDKGLSLYFLVEDVYKDLIDSSFKYDIAPEYLPVFLDSVVWPLA